VTCLATVAKWMQRVDEIILQKYLERTIDEGERDKRKQNRLYVGVRYAQMGRRMEWNE